MSKNILDTELLAQSTKDNLHRSFKKLELRKKFKDAGRMKPRVDYKIWEMEVKIQTGDLQNSLEKCKKIVAALDKLQRDCTKTHDNITLELDGFASDLKAESDQKNIKLA